MKKFSGEYVLNGLMFDVQRMIRERQNPKLILGLIKKKVNFLEKPNYYKIEWWEKTKREYDEEALRLAYVDNQDTARSVMDGDDDVSYY
jgi:hypothetical protein